MKVGTDGVLLGAWAKVAGCSRILDVGCGSGLISLMVAQREPNATVRGIDVQRDAVDQARENVHNSPFRERVTIEEADVRRYVGKFDCIVCNPPFFNEHTKPLDAGRALARNASSLSYDELCQAADALLLPEGFFNVVLPTSVLPLFNAIAIGCGFGIYRILHVRTVETKPPRRTMITYCKGTCQTVEESAMVLQNLDGSRSEEYQQLTSDFYLSFS